MRDNEFEVEYIRKDGEFREGEITFGLDLYDSDDLLADQVRPCVFRPAPYLQSSLADRVQEDPDTEFEIYNLSKSHVGLEDRHVGYVGKVRWKANLAYDDDCYIL